MHIIISLSLCFISALVDLDPSQLLLFVQSFGIPVGSMTRLLHCLDGAVQMDPRAMENAIVDKSYMAQLIEVQRMRGATGGSRFYEMLLDGHSAPEPLGMF
jgi:integrator complex subunit 1